MTMNTSIIEKLNPNCSDFIESWNKRYEKEYNFEDLEQQALFYEGVLELARFVAKNNKHALIKSEICPQGFSELKISLS